MLGLLLPSFCSVSFAGLFGYFPSVAFLCCGVALILSCPPPPATIYLLLLPGWVGHMVVFAFSVGCHGFLPCFLFPAPLLLAPFPAHGVLSCGVRLVCFLGVLSAFTCSIRPSGITLFLLLLSPSIEAPGWLGGTTLFCLWAPLCSLLDGAFVWASPLVT